MNQGIQMEMFSQPKITGYRQLTEADAVLMNEAKALAEQCGAFITKLRSHADSTRHGSSTQRVPVIDHKWVGIGATDLQKGWMSIIRSIAQPTTF